MNILSERLEPPGCVLPVFARSRTLWQETLHAVGVNSEPFVVHFQGRRYQMAANIAGRAGPVKGLRGADYGPNKLRIAGRAGSPPGAFVIEVTVREEKTARARRNGPQNLQPNTGIGR